jgi:hypothetical protein
MFGDNLRRNNPHMKTLILALVFCTFAAVSANAVPNCSQECNERGCTPESGRHGECTSACQQDVIVTCSETPGGQCSAAPTVVISLSRSMIWPPNHKMVSVSVNGTITEPANCVTLSKSCALTDEYGLFSGAVSLSGGDSFTGASFVEAWRLGQDMDGRNYSYTCTATNSFGTGTSNTAIATVPHDQR